jgi:hypothetical protein
VSDHLLSVPDLSRVVLGAQFLSTFAMFGLIWFVQIVHYPLFLRIAEEDFTAFEAEHARRTGYVAAPLMIVELLSSFALVYGPWRPASIPGMQAVAGAGLTALTWASTFLLSVPLHNRLHRGFNRTAIHRLVATNWVRTVLWTARAALLVSWLARMAGSR